MTPKINASQTWRTSGGRLLVSLLILPLLSPAVTFAGESRDEPVTRTAATPHAKISEEQAKQAALKAVPGEVTDATIEKKRGKMVYVIEIVARDDGAETDVLVDMDSGAVLGVEH
jgi:uncharacterized membrane protein YkoI